MSYVIYNKETTRKLDSKYYATEAAAKAALTRAAKKDNTLIKADYTIAETNNFYDNIELMVERTNLLSGKKYMERANTPLCCSPSSETYWSM
jgi:hypothetical protein